MNGTKLNIENRMVYYIHGRAGAYYAPNELPEVIGRLMVESKSWRNKGWDGWKPVRVNRDVRNGVIEIWFESVYYDAAYRPRVWRC